MILHSPLSISLFNGCIVRISFNPKDFVEVTTPRRQHNGEEKKGEEDFHFLNRQQKKGNNQHEERKSDAVRHDREILGALQDKKLFAEFALLGQIG